MNTTPKNTAAMRMNLPASGVTRLRPKEGWDANACDRSQPARVDYWRSRDLPGMIALWPREVHDTSIKGALTVIAKLRRAIRAERRRGSAGHWTYDLERHLSLTRALKAEIAFLEDRKRRSEPDRPK